MTITRTLPLAVLIFAAGARQSPAQWPASRPIPVRSCPLADSLLGPHRHDAVVRAAYSAAVDSSRLTIVGAKLVARVVRPGRAPEPFPEPIVTFMFDPGRGADQLYESRAVPATVTLLLDDSLRLAAGAGHVARFQGAPPPRRGVVRVPVTIQTIPSLALELARATRARVTADFVHLDVPRDDLRAFAGFYRVAVCDSIPLP